MTRGIRNCNPGNIRSNRLNNWKGMVGTDSGNFCVFKDFTYGIRALAVTLRTYITKRRLTRVQDIIERFAPSFENHTEEYIRFVSSYISKNDDVYCGYITNNEQFLLLICAIIYFENGIYAEREIVKSVNPSFCKTLYECVHYSLSYHVVKSPF